MSLRGLPTSRPSVSSYGQHYSSTIFAANQCLTRQIRRLTESEAQSKRKMGVCYYCDEKWGPGHRCKRRELQRLGPTVEARDADEKEPMVEEDNNVEDLRKERIDEDPRIKVSLHSVAGLTSPSKMHLRGFIGTQEVITLINLGGQPTTLFL